MARRSLFVVTLGLAAVAGACGQAQEASDAAARTTAASATTPTTGTTVGSAEAAVASPSTTAGAADATGVGLAGVDWQLATLLEGESSGPVPNGVQVDLRIDGTELTVSTGCNRGGGSVSTDGGALRLTQPLLLTQRGCEGDALRVEQFVIKVLDSNPMFRIEAGRLRLDSGIGRSLEFVPAA